MCREFSSSRGIIAVLRNICYVPKWEFYYIDFLKERNMQTKGGIRERPRRRRGLCLSWTLPLWPCRSRSTWGLPLCHLEVKDTAATLSLILDGGKNICFGARQKWVQILVPLLISGENLPLRLRPPLQRGDWEERGASGQAAFLSFKWAISTFLGVRKV